MFGKDKQMIRTQDDNIFTGDELRQIAEAVDNANSSAEYISALFKAAARMRDAILDLLPPEPEQNPKNGPCCHEFEDGYWIGTGCDCGNFDDAADAAWWASVANARIRALKVLREHDLLDLLEIPNPIPEGPNNQAHLTPEQPQAAEGTLPAQPVKRSGAAPLLGNNEERQK